MLGILSERLGLRNTALKSYKEALVLSQPNDRDKVLINYGRMLVHFGEHEKAIETYKAIKNASFKGGCGLAYALFKGINFLLQFIFF